MARSIESRDTARMPAIKCSLANFRNNSYQRLKSKVLKTHYFLKWFLEVQAPEFFKNKQPLVDVLTSCFSKNEPRRPSKIIEK